MIEIQKRAFSVFGYLLFLDFLWSRDLRFLTRIAAITTITRIAKIGRKDESKYGWVVGVAVVSVIVAVGIVV